MTRRTAEGDTTWPAGGHEDGHGISATPAAIGRVGLVPPQVEDGYAERTPPWHDVRAVARRVEEVGFDSLWLIDHLTDQFPFDDDAVPPGLATSSSGIEPNTIAGIEAFAKVLEQVDRGEERQSKPPEASSV